jgi:hypothetical protein
VVGSQVDAVFGGLVDDASLLLLDASLLEAMREEMLLDHALDSPGLRVPAVLALEDLLGLTARYATPGDPFTPTVSAAARIPAPASRWATVPRARPSHGSRVALHRPASRWVAKGSQAAPPLCTAIPASAAYREPLSAPVRS